MSRGMQCPTCRGSDDDCPRCEGWGVLSLLDSLLYAQRLLDSIRPASGVAETTP